MSHLLLYDGVCGMCDRIVQFVLAHDRRDQFRFASLQSELAGQLLERYGRAASDLDTAYIVVDHGLPGERLLARGRAALFVLRRMGWRWAWMAALGILPTFVLDVGYNFIARRRYKWFGKHDQCILPSPAVRQKFLDQAPVNATSSSGR